MQFKEGVVPRGIWQELPKAWSNASGYPRLDLLDRAFDIFQKAHDWDTSSIVLESRERSGGVILRLFSEDEELFGPEGKVLRSIVRSVEQREDPSVNNFSFVDVERMSTLLRDEPSYLVRNWLSVFRAYEGEINLWDEGEREPDFWHGAVGTEARSPRVRIERGRGEQQSVEIEISVPGYGVPLVLKIGKEESDLKRRIPEDSGLKGRMGLAIAASQIADEYGRGPFGAFVEAGRDDGFLGIVARNEARPDNILSDLELEKHAEMIAMRRLLSEGGRSMVGVTIYSSMEPCNPCATGIFSLGISRVIYALKNSQYFSGQRTFEQGIEFVVASQGLSPGEVYWSQDPKNIDQALKVIENDNAFPLTVERNYEIWLDYLARKMRGERHIPYMFTRMGHPTEDTMSDEEIARRLGLGDSEVE